MYVYILRTYILSTYISLYIYIYYTHRKIQYLHQGRAGAECSRAACARQVDKDDPSQPVEQLPVGFSHGDIISNRTEDAKLLPISERSESPGHF